jgi:dipeptidyl aminopeptidase/acylaminoacyl peptidase
MAGSVGSASAEVVFGSDRCEDGGVLMPVPPNVDGRRPCKSGIFRVHDDGTGFQRLTNGELGGEGDGDAQPRWSPTGAKILFSHRAGPGLRLYVMDPDGSDPEPLGDGPPYPFDNQSEPAWSPLGTRIAYTASITDGSKPGIVDDSSAIFVVDAAGGDPRRVSPAAFDSTAPTFTPDGRGVVYYAAKAHAQHRTPADGYYGTDLVSGRTQRVSFGGIDVVANGISFSPDGRHVAVMSGEPQLYTMRADGTELTKRGGPGTFTPASWSPFALFSQAYPPSGNQYRSVIYRLNLLGPSVPAQLTEPTGFDWAPSWSSLSGELPELPSDFDPPLVLIGRELDVGQPLSFLATDVSGVRRLDVSLAKRTHGRCRFLRDGKLRRARSCSKGRFFRVKGAKGLKAWRKRTKTLPRGRYELRFRTTDGEHNRTKHPRRRRVRLK